MKKAQITVWSSSKGRELFRSVDDGFFFLICHVSVDELREVGEAITDALKERGAEFCDPLFSQVPVAKVQGD